MEDSIKAHLAPLLRADGFRGSGRNYRRVVNGLVQVVNVQGSKWGGEFAINLACHPIDLPDVVDKPINPKTITEYLCEFRRRLAPGNDDCWWPYENIRGSMDHAVVDAAAAYAARGRKLLDEFATPDSPLHRLTSADWQDWLQRGTWDMPATEARLLLILARFRAAKGRTGEAREFARVGVSLPDLHADLRRRFEVILGDARSGDSPIGEVS